MLRVFLLFFFEEIPPQPSLQSVTLWENFSACLPVISTFLPYYAHLLSRERLCTCSAPRILKFEGEAS